MDDQLSHRQSRTQLAARIAESTIELCLSTERVPMHPATFLDIARGQAGEIANFNTKRAAVGSAASAANIYFSRFGSEPDWRFVKAQMTLLGGRPDIVFQREDGLYIVDELKMTHSVPDGRLPEHLDQCRKYLEICTQCLGPTVVRLLYLTRPERSGIVSARGVSDIDGSIATEYANA